MTEGYLTTHVLDIYNGKPASDINVDLYNIKEERFKIKSFKLNKDGRSEGAIIKGNEFIIGKYELVFFVGTYFETINKLKQPYFLDDVVIRFGISNPLEHYHVPLLVSPWSYSTYRGS
tara:strand:- start:2175 stop:2528 length:354 start_codon:yes stop_codon:yes gene_type:complete